MSELPATDTPSWFQEAADSPHSKDRQCPHVSSSVSARRKTTTRWRETAYSRDAFVDSRDQEHWICNVNTDMITDLLNPYMFIKLRERSIFPTAKMLNALQIRQSWSKTIHKNGSIKTFVTTQSFMQTAIIR